MKQILATGDLHIGQASGYGIVQEGLPTKMAEQKELLRQFVDDAIARKVELVVFGGDYFPKHIKINPDAVRIFSEQVLRLSEAGIPVRMVVGNHDKARHEKLDNTIDYFGVFNVPHVKIIAKPTVELFQNVILMFFPHLIPSELFKYQLNEREGVTEIINRIVNDMAGEASAIIQTNQLPPETKRIFFGHFGLVEAGKGSESQMLAGNNICVPTAVLDRSDINLCILSHIHKFWVNKHATQTKIVVIGSMDRFDFGEANDKKVYGRIEIGDNPGDNLHMTVVPTQARKFVNIKEVVDDSLDLSFMGKYDIENAVIKAIFTTTKDFTKKKALKEKVETYLQDHKAYCIYHIGFIPEVSNVARNNTVTEEKTVEENVLEILKNMQGQDELVVVHKDLFEEVKKDMTEER